MKDEFKMDGKRVRVLTDLWNGNGDHFRVGDVVTYRRSDRLKADDGREITGVKREDFELIEPLPTKERCKDVVGKLVKLTREIENFRGERFAKGSRWRVYNTHRGRFQLEAVNDKGETIYSSTTVVQNIIRMVRRKDFEIEATN